MENLDTEQISSLGYFHSRAIIFFKYIKENRLLKNLK